MIFLEPVGAGQRQDLRHAKLGGAALPDGVLQVGARARDLGDDRAVRKSQARLARAPGGGGPRAASSASSKLSMCDDATCAGVVRLLMCLLLGVKVLIVHALAPLDGQVGLPASRHAARRPPRPPRRSSPCGSAMRPQEPRCCGCRRRRLLTLRRCTVRSTCPLQ